MMLGEVLTLFVSVLGGMMQGRDPAVICGIHVTVTL